MRTITAPEPIDGWPQVFLAGGITNCPDWQSTVISLLAGFSGGVLLNPRRSNFPIYDPNAAREQIAWEFRALRSAHIFSMWFCASESVQPICMYELGCHLERLRDQPARVVIGIEPGYKREQDVRIQTELANPEIAATIEADLAAHADRIRQACLLWEAKPCGKF